VRHRGRFRGAHCYRAARSGFEFSGGCRAKSSGTMALHQPLKNRTGRIVMRAWKLAAIAASMLVAYSAAAEPVKITNTGHGYYSGVLYVAQREKLFEKYGLEPDVSFVQGGPLALQAALTQPAAVELARYAHPLTAAVQGKRVVAFFNI